MKQNSLLRLTKDTLLLLPCSGKKQPVGVSERRRSILATLDPESAMALSRARNALRETAKIEDSMMMPAYKRYSGQLYEQGSKAIGCAVDEGFPIAIVSGGYGLVAAEEDIGNYEKEFVRSDWPAGLLEACIVQHARRLGVRTVFAVMAKTSPYAELVRKVRWREAGLVAKLIVPVCPKWSGAQGKVPRAQGEMISELLGVGLDGGWTSSDNLSFDVKDL